MSRRRHTVHNHAEVVARAVESARSYASAFHDEPATLRDRLAFAEEMASKLRDLAGAWRALRAKYKPGEELATIASRANKAASARAAAKYDRQADVYEAEAAIFREALGAIKVGDRVRQSGAIYLIGTVRRLLRANEFYHRRAEVEWDTGRVETLAAHVLVKDDGDASAGGTNP
jgi:hypothetical protein